VSKCWNDQESSLCPSSTSSKAPRSGHLDVRSDYRLAAADCRPHRFSEHRVDARTAVLHLPCDTNDRAFAIGDYGSVNRGTMRAIEAGPLSVDCLKVSHTNVHAARGAFR